MLCIATRRRRALSVWRPPGVKTSAKCCSRREEGPVALKQVLQAVLRLLCSNFYRRSIGRTRLQCVSGNYCDHISRSSSINGSVLVETIILSGTILFEVMTPCSFIYRYHRFGKRRSIAIFRVEMSPVEMWFGYKRECASFVTTHSWTWLPANLKVWITTVSTQHRNDS